MQENMTDKAEKKEKKRFRPGLKALRRELDRERTKRRARWTVGNMSLTLGTVAAVAVLVAMLLLPVLLIHGTSMAPTMTDGNIIVCVKSRNLEQGDIVAFYYNNQILVKRMIANPGDWVDIDDDGNVYVNGELIDEPYLQEKAFGETNIKLPYQVPENRIFVLGDHRSVSIDSRNTSVGCVPYDRLVGKLLLRIWPINQLGTVE